MKRGRGRGESLLFFEHRPSPLVIVSSLPFRHPLVATERCAKFIWFSGIFPRLEWRNLYKVRLKHFAFFAFKPFFKHMFNYSAVNDSFTHISVLPDLNLVFVLVFTNCVYCTKK